MSDQSAAARPPVGFGRGRRTGRVAILDAATSGWKTLPPRIFQWSPAEELDSWTRVVSNGLLVGADATGFDLAWHYWLKGEKPEQLARTIGEQVDGVVLVARARKTWPCFPLLEEAGLPCIVAYAYFQGLLAPYVTCDNAGGVKQMVRHLADLGHCRIAYLGGPQGVADLLERRRGFCEGMTAEGLAIDPELMVGESLARQSDDVRPLAGAPAAPPQPTDRGDLRHRPVGGEPDGGRLGDGAECAAGPGRGRLRRY